MFMFVLWSMETIKKRGGKAFAGVTSLVKRKSMWVEVVSDETCEKSIKCEALTMVVKSGLLPITFTHSGWSRTTPGLDQFMRG